MNFKINKNWNRAYKILTPVVVFIVLGYFLRGFTTNRYPDISRMNTFFLLTAALILGFFIHTIIHEAGHLIFGKLSGYSFHSFRIGNMMWLKEGGEIRRKRLTVSGAGGECLMTPPDMADGKFPYRLYQLGGVLANLIAAGIFGFLAFVTLDNQFLSLFLFFLALVGLLIAYMNGFPMTTGLLDNDGRNVRNMNRDPHARRSFWITLKIQELMTKGVRLKDMPDHWFSIPEDMPLNNSLSASMAVYGANRLMDGGKLREADEAIGDLLTSGAAVGGLHKNLLIADRIYIELVLRNFPDRLEKLITKPQRDFMKAMTDYPSVIRTEYAYALISQKDGEKAGRFKDQFEKMAKSHPHPAKIHTEFELMELAEEAKERQQHLSRGRKSS